MTTEFAAPLPDWGVLALSGEDAVPFLHGQLTNDVEALPVGGAQWNGWCSPKGRLLATFLLLRRADQCLLLLPRELAAPIAKRLAMFVLRSKVKVRDASAEHAIFGVAGVAALGSTAGATPSMTAVETAHGLVAAIDDRRAFVIAPPDIRFEEIPAGTSDDWRRELILAGIPVITAATQDAFVPQMATFALVGGVSFRKGCYPGQEIVARTQDRGILKRRMAHARAASGPRPAPGESVYSARFGDQAAGTVVDAAPSPEGGFELLVVAQLDSLQEGVLHMGTPQGPALQVLGHPAAQPA